MAAIKKQKCESHQYDSYKDSRFFEQSVPLLLYILFHNDSVSHAPQKEKLEAEGHEIIQKGRKNIRYYVKNYEDVRFDRFENWNSVTGRGFGM